MTVKEIKAKIFEMCQTEKAQTILNKESDDALHYYHHIFCTTNTDSVAFIVFDENEIAFVGFKSKAKKADYEKVLEYLETILADSEPEESNAATWEEQKVTVTMTNAEWSKLSVSILMTTQFRKGEIEACKSLAEEREPDGTLTFPNMPSNAKFWEEMNALLETIEEKIEKRGEIR